MPFNNTSSAQSTLLNHEAQLVEYLSQHKSYMSLPQLQGFLYAISCCPYDYISDNWQQQVLPNLQVLEQNSSYRQLINLLNDLLHQTQQQVLKLNYQLPISCLPKFTPTDNFFTSSPFHQWSLGFMNGYLLVRELWLSYLPVENQRDFSTAIFILGFFADRPIAEAVCEESNLGDITQLCLQLLTKLPEAIDSLNRFSLELHRAIKVFG